MSRTLFKGVGTALITPFKDDGIDYDAMEKLIEYQIEKKVDALIIAGTTGEGSTLNDFEHRHVVDFAVKKVRKRIPVIAGTGSNDTAYGLELTKACNDLGVDGVLVVTPYYNKTTQDGLYNIYSEYAKVSKTPIIMYNVPSRTGVNILPETVERLAENENIIAIKEASGNISQVADIMARVGGRMDVYSGNDDQIVPILSLGGIGVISVLSNVIPEETHNMVIDYLEGDVKKSCSAQLKYLELINSLFSEVNPIPVKAAMSYMGMCKNILRSPLYPISKENEKRLKNALKDINITVED